MTDCHFLDGNAWGVGGGIYAKESAANIQRNLFQGCNADGGGALCITEPPDTATIANNLFVDCYTTNHVGGALYAHGSISFVNNTVVHCWTTNYTQAKGGGLYQHSGALLAKNNIITGCKTFGGGAGIHCEDGVSVTCTTNDVYDNTLYSGSTPADYYGCTPDAGSISLDPLFVDALQGNHRLAPGSPAIDSGTGTDADGSPADMGAFGAGGMALTYSEWIASEGLSGAAALDTADPDADGLSNYFEFLHGTSAVTANAMYPATQSITGDEWVLEYTINQMALAAGLVLEKSTDLQNWTPVSASSVLSPADPIGTVRVHLDIAGARATFVRLHY